jgi:hypothetical protein
VTLPAPPDITGAPHWSVGLDPHAVRTGGSLLGSVGRQRASRPRRFVHGERKERRERRPRRRRCTGVLARSQLDAWRPMKIGGSGRC